MKKLILIIILFAYTANAQKLSLFNIDSSNFPNIKAKFRLFDSDFNQIKNPNINDFEISENGKIRKITNISCPAPQAATNISSVITIDVSGSMIASNNGISNIDLAKISAKSWIDALPTNLSQSAITAFDSYNYLFQDFTNDRTTLKNAIDKLKANGGTDYNEGYLGDMYGAIKMMNKAKYKKIIIFVTDGLPNNNPDITSIINSANSNNISIFNVTLGMPCPQSLKDISNQTGGQWFESVTTLDQAKLVYANILQKVQNNEACEIEWVSGPNCLSSSINVNLKWNNELAYSAYYAPNNSIGLLEVKPNFISFGKKNPGIKVDTTINIKAINSDFTIKSIKISNPSQIYSITNVQFPLIIPKNSSKSITISYFPKDSNLSYSAFEIETDACSAFFSANGGFPSSKTKLANLKLTKPNGNEKFVVGSDTLITWEGIAKTDTVHLEYSTNNGKDWQKITNKASGLEYNWKNIPKPTSNQCLAKVYQGEIKNDSSPKIEWQKTFGGANIDKATSMILTSNNTYLVVGNTSSQDNDMNNVIYSEDIWVANLDLDGNLLWKKSIGGNGVDFVNCIRENSDGTFILNGSTSSSNLVPNKTNNISELWILKLDNSGNILWQKVYNIGSGNKTLSIMQNRNNGYDVFGYTDRTFYGGYDYYFMKLDMNGNLLFDKTYGGSFEDKCMSGYSTIDGGSILCGWTYSSDGDVTNYKGESDWWIVKINSKGDIEWQKTIGGISNEVANSIKQTKDGGYIVGGWARSKSIDPLGYKGEGDFTLVKLDASGNQIWSKMYGGSADDDIIILNETIDGGFICSGWSKSSDNNIKNKGLMDIWTIKTNNLGLLVWQKSIGGFSNEEANAIVEAPDGGVVLAGYSNSNNGDLLKNNGNSDMWLVKLIPTNDYAQSDISDNTFSIVAPEVEARDIDMGKTIVNVSKDSLLQNYIINIGDYKSQIRNIYFESNDFDQFQVVSGLPVYDLDAKSSHNLEIRFKPKSLGMKSSKIVIITQSDTLKYNVIGEAFAPMLAVINKNIDFGKVKIGSNKDTTDVFTIQNISNTSIEFNKTKHNLPNDIDFSTINNGGPFTLAPNEIRKMNLQFKPSAKGRTNGILEFHYNGLGSPAIVSLFGEGISPDLDCEGSNFVYKNFENLNNLNLGASAIQTNEKTIRLTESKLNEIGAVSYNERVSVRNNFTMKLSFRFSKGDNYQFIDGSLPGADGIALLFQNGKNFRVTKKGGSLGYHGIENCVALEVDMYRNILEYNDPNGNHVALQVPYKDTVSSYHDANHTVKMNENIFEIRPDSTIYYGMLNYDYYKKHLDFYLDSNKNTTNLVLSVDNFDFAQYLKLEKGDFAYIGITSTTGASSEIHEILSWEFCSDRDEFLGVEDEYYQSEEIVQNENILSLDNAIIKHIRVMDYVGKMLINEEKDDNSLDLSRYNLSDGVYFVFLTDDQNRNYYKKIVLSR